MSLHGVRATTVRIGASRVNNVRELLDWLHANVGEFNGRELTGTGTEYTGANWTAKWRPFGAGWFMDVRFNDPKHAAFFTLRWK
jgi:hypothetical protein